MILIIKSYVLQTWDVCFGLMTCLDWICSLPASLSKSNHWVVFSHSHINHLAKVCMYKESWSHCTKSIWSKHNFKTSVKYTKLHFDIHRRRWASFTYCFLDNFQFTKYISVEVMWAAEDGYYHIALCTGRWLCCAWEKMPLALQWFFPQLAWKPSGWRHHPEAFPTFNSVFLFQGKSLL